MNLEDFCAKIALKLKNLQKGSKRAKNGWILSCFLLFIELYLDFSANGRKHQIPGQILNVLIPIPPMKAVK